MRIRPQNFSRRQVDADRLEEEEVRVFENDDAAGSECCECRDVVLAPDERPRCSFVRRGVVQGGRKTEEVFFVGELNDSGVVVLLIGNARFVFLGPCFVGLESRRCCCGDGIWDDGDEE